MEAFLRTAELVLLNPNSRYSKQKEGYKNRMSYGLGEPGTQNANELAEGSKDQDTGQHSVRKCTSDDSEDNSDIKAIASEKLYQPVLDLTEEGSTEGNAVAGEVQAGNTLQELGVEGGPSEKDSALEQESHSSRDTAPSTLEKKLQEQIKYLEQELDIERVPMLQL